MPPKKLRAIFSLSALAVFLLLPGCSASQKNPAASNANAAVTDTSTTATEDNTMINTETTETDAEESDITGSTETTTSYKTYTNDKRGYSVEYPEDWRIDESLDNEEIREVSFRGPAAEGDRIYFSVALDSSSLQDFIDTYAFATPTAKMQRTTFAGKNALVYTFTEIPGRQEMMVENGDIYIIFTEETNRSEIQYMLQSFKFL